MAPTSPRATLLRAPRMNAESGVWLEGFSKWDAQVMLYWVPYFVVVGLMFFNVPFYVIDLYLPSLADGVMLIDDAVHYMFLLVCAGYVALVAPHVAPCSQCASVPHWCRHH